MLEEKPYYVWVAKFRDGRVVRQFENEKVNHFNQDILPFSDSLSEFWLEGENGRKYGINLLTGDFDINGTRFSDLGVLFARHIDDENKITEPLRPIYFRRTTRNLDFSSGKEINHIYVYAIGWQATVKISVPPINGEKYWHEEIRNVKHILYIHESTGDLVFG